jgi:hypothetical protein
MRRFRDDFAVIAWRGGQAAAVSAATSESVATGSAVKALAACQKGLNAASRMLCGRDGRARRPNFAGFGSGNFGQRAWSVFAMWFSRQFRDSRSNVLNS